MAQTTKNQLSMTQLRQNLKHGKIASVYLVLGQETYLMEQAKSAFMALLQPDERAMNFANYDLTHDTLPAAINDAMSMPFFGERRMVWLTDPFILTTEVVKGAPEQDVNSLVDYLAHPLDTTVLVIFVAAEKLDGRKKISKLVQKQAITVNVQKVAARDIEHSVSQFLTTQGYELDKDSRELLIQRSNSSYSDIIANLHKLFLAAGKEKVITKQMISDLVSPTLENNVFDLVERVLRRDVAGALALYQDLILNKEEPIRINSILISQFRLLLQVKILMDKGMTQGNLASILKVHPFRIKLALRTIRKFSLADLQQAYLGLQANDYQMKSSQADKTLLFELFMLKFAG